MPATRRAAPAGTGPAANGPPGPGAARFAPGGRPPGALAGPGSRTALRLAGVAVGAARRDRLRTREGRLPDPDAGDLRELPRGPRRCACAAARGARGGGARRASDPVARAAADLAGRLRLPRLRPHGRPP